MPDQPFDEGRLRRTFAGRRVLITGHTGFKGGWIALWLHRLGAEVCGVSLEPGSPSFFDAVGLDGLIDHRIADITDAAAFKRSIDGFAPELVFHMAAQALVRESFSRPVETLATNVLGTAIVLDAARRMPALTGVVAVTSDKCYQNSEWEWGYRESDPMGGDDVYSASKACAELVVHSYRHSFFPGADAPIIASVRAGNVLGGGDWAKDRIIPDIVRGALAGETVRIRNPHSVRPWQHVLEPLAGYLEVGARMLEGDRSASGAWNFGPSVDGVVDVGSLARMMQAAWGRGRPEFDFGRTNGDPPENHLLRLDSTKANVSLGWRPRLSVEQAIGLAVDWYRTFASGTADMRALSLQQIDAYLGTSRSAVSLQPVVQKVSACA